jgi:hypothetical protein
VALLLGDPRVDPSSWDNASIRLASRNGHAEIVQMLLEDPRVDPTVRDNEALRRAQDRNHPQVMKVLLNDPRVNPALKAKAIAEAKKNSIQNLKLELKKVNEENSTLKNTVKERQEKLNKLEKIAQQIVEVCQDKKI